MTFLQVERLLEDLNRLGFSLLSTGGHAMQKFTSVLPGWYARRIHDLLGIIVPRAYARRFYNMILGQNEILNQREPED